MLLGLGVPRESPGPRRSPAFYPSAGFILPSPRLPSERRAGDEKPLAAGAGGGEEGEAGP